MRRQVTQETVTRIPLGSDEATRGHDLYIILSLQHPLSLLCFRLFKTISSGCINGLLEHLLCVLFECNQAIILMLPLHRHCSSRKIKLK